MALGADVTVFTSSDSKIDDIKKMGAHKIINYVKNKDWVKEAGEDFDLILSTRDVSGDDFPISDFLGLLNIHCKFVTVGLPDDPFPNMTGFAFAGSGCFFGGSHIGSKKEAIEMLNLCAEKGKFSFPPDLTWSTTETFDIGIRTWIQELPMSKAAEAVQGVKDNTVRYRYVLKQDIDP